MMNLSYAFRDSNLSVMLDMEALSNMLKVCQKEIMSHVPVVKIIVVSTLN